MAFQFRYLLAALALAVVSAAFAQEPADFAKMRGILADAIEKGVNRMRERTGGQAIDPRVIAAVRKVPRHEFAPPELRPYAYLDRPLPVGPDATISQPSLVAVMTDLLGIKNGEKVLEVGIGGGYHTAILAEMTQEVFSVEYHKEAAQTARRTLERLGYSNIRVNVADGYHGWRPDAPYDAILVRMAIPEIASSLVAQLKPGGRLIAPVGPADSVQVLTLLQKDSDGRVTETAIMPVFFRALPGGLRL
ncbi:MAG: protein-L-isoaspartate O-methyltransferase [Betaproteobacteria bacterium RIFCSPLOWO2_12_FULL_62_13]|nr:MAG: protein-L-isoaspartate O-methyltransferase [Betaproteobacteria bacterium RIFCSPLOWO2_12_FULL_62_13]